jgi:Tol biopolymer transport system component
MYHTVRLAPDGRRAVADIGSTGGSYVHDLLRRTRTLLVRSPTSANNPGWTPDGARVTFAAPGQGGTAIVEKNADGTGDERAVFSTPGNYTEPSWSSDGRLLLITAIRPGTGADIAVVTRAGSPQALVATPADERAARFSPDGRWMTYQSDESGRPEIYVQPYPGPGPRVLVSTAGGTAPVWARDGSELFYQEGTALMAVPVRTAPTFAIGTPTRLFDAPVTVDGTGHPAYDVAPDGQRFLMIQNTPVNQVKVVLNWVEALKKTAP